MSLRQYLKLQSYRGKLGFRDGLRKAYSGGVAGVSGFLFVSGLLLRSMKKNRDIRR